jgi:hypothetical protein
MHDTGENSIDYNKKTKHPLCMKLLSLNRQSFHVNKLDNRLLKIRQLTNTLKNEVSSFANELVEQKKSQQS